MNLLIVIIRHIKSLTVPEEYFVGQREEDKYSDIPHYHNYVTSPSLFAQIGSEML